MQETDKQELVDFLSLLENRLDIALQNKYDLIPPRILPGLEQAWVEVRPNIAQIKEGIRNLDVNTAGPAFDMRGLSGAQLQIKMKLIYMAEELFTTLEKQLPYSWLYLIYTQIMLGVLGGAGIGSMGILAAAIIASLTGGDPFHLITGAFPIIIGAASAGAILAWGYEKWKEAKGYLSKSGQQLLKPIKLILKPANTVLGSIASAWGHSPAGVGLAGMTEGLKEFKEMVESAFDHREHHANSAMKKERQVL